MPGLRHVVAVNMQFEEGDPRIKEFFDETKKVYSVIPEVLEYHHYKQIIPDVPYSYGFVLDFDDQEGFDKCVATPSALEYVKNYWNDKYLKDVLEVNYIEFD